MNPDPVQLKKINVRIFSSFTAEPLATGFERLAKLFGYDLNLLFTNPAEFVQDLLTERDTNKINFDVNLLLFRIQDFLPDQSDDRLFNETYLKKILNVITTVLGEITLTKSVIFCLYPVYLPQSEVIHQKVKHLQTDFLNNINNISALTVVDGTNWTSSYSNADVYDAISYRQANIPFTHDFYNITSVSLWRAVVASVNSPFKAILLDCDNTLWSGVCGELGTYGITVTDSHQDLQRFIKELSKKGFLLGLLSKNNEADVWDVFEKNTSMVLSKDDFVCWRINWKPKSENISEVALELNLGIDSFIFIDDDNKECMDMMKIRPEVFTFQLPPEQTSINIYLKNCWVFDKSRITLEDAMRTSAYKEEKLRTQYLNEAISISDFLADLNIKVSMQKICNDDLERISQLTFRTNQFNLSTVRLTVPQLMDMVSHENNLCWAIRVSDRFGVYGLVGFLQASFEGKTVNLESYMLSCRVLGRGVEELIMDGLVVLCKSNGFEKIRATYRPTLKNVPIKEHLEKTWILVRKESLDTVFERNVTETHRDNPSVGELYFEKPLPQFENIPAGGYETPPSAIHDLNVSDNNSVQVFWEQKIYNEPNLHHLPYYKVGKVFNMPQASNLFAELMPDLDNLRLSTPIQLIEQALSAHNDISGFKVIEDLATKDKIKIVFKSEANISTLAIRKYLLERTENLPYKRFEFVKENVIETSDSRTPVGVELSEKESAFFNEIKQIWESVLELKSVNKDDNFFDIGGNSFQVIRIISKIENKFQLKPTFKDFFNQSLMQFCWSINKNEELH